MGPNYILGVSNEICDCINDMDSNLDIGITAA
jgi:hypothetical protein